ncbi:MAG: TetR/AcrR family transcriptional regulator [Phycisphaerales bacterium]|jgi:AcrR family transcriptional regulator|nr:TetR/AcrR family transcriptional regulator [Phycisphaerales bacterium]
MLQLVSEGGMPVAASVRSIARRAGVTEAVLYRYFPNKDAMFREVWDSTLAPMVEEKRQLLAAAESSAVDTLRSWIEISYRHFDQDPAAFHYVFLSEGTATWRSDPSYGVQSALLKAWLETHVDAAAIAPLSHERACDYFVSIMLSVPRRIRLGKLEGPASTHTAEALTVAQRLLGL